MSGNPFALDDASAYGRWRDRKLTDKPKALTDLVVEVGDMAALSPAEHAALGDRLRRANMVIYAETKPAPGRDDKQALAALGRAFGLVSLDRNHLADDDGITPLAVAADGPRSRYIPYTERPIAWHSDGYYNPQHARVRGLILHCVRPAAAGGENRLMDPELLYIALRERDPALIAALMRPDAMTIPGNEDEGMTRPAMTGPVFFVEDGRLCMRYTARTRSIEWHPEAAAAAQVIRDILESGAELFTGLLQPGWGLLCNNVLHTRERFTDDPAQPRLLYRARYHDAISGV
ncbi:TauD/TfdA family dioxygenase [Magnetospirillum gryphiswaldense]|nr:TauD/TfdA family dioxygenase [Magnetospirillum gryphiswaldense]AVM74982.1 Taurine catabolism dioxygenase TauD, TfdA family [Magnetospirillum gryphiswaldense MSR-1]AVM78885.1 Taurine catabolism dioxygenase TauD, TfdA family [Magnetospirillum gryphiswaldense]